MVSELSNVRWNEPEGIAPRGTLLVFPGRAETPAVYRRFGKRLAADAYRVVVVTPDEASAVVEDPSTVRPVVAVGADTGALAALAFATAQGDRVGGVVVAGLPADADCGGPHGIEERTACPAHRAVLEAELDSHAAPAPVAIDLGLLATPAASERIRVPLLAVHGSADSISPLEGALHAYRERGADQITVIEGGLHDILNDVSHRSVAATIVLFLERLRLGSDLPVIARDASVNVE